MGPASVLAHGGGDGYAFCDDEGDWSLSLPLVSNAMQTAPDGSLVSHVSFLTEGGIVGCQILEHS